MQQFFTVRSCGDLLGRIVIMNTRICGINIMLLNAFIILPILASGIPAAELYEVEFSTYIGGIGYEHIRDICADKQGNVYIAGGTTSSDYPTTPGAYQRTHGGMFDIFVTKFDPTGNIIWSTLVGGKDYDRAYAIEVDDQGYVYVAGRGGRDAPITPGVVQETFKGQWAGGPYKSDMNAYVFKLSPDGSKLIWATYFGTGEKFRDIDIDREGNVYGVWHDPLNPKNPHKDTWREESWFTNAFQKEPQGGEGDIGVVKISPDGSRCIWATYLTGSGKETGAASVRVDDKGYVYAETWTYSSDMPTTPGVHDRTHNGEADYYIARLTPDGSELVFGTYIGGSKQEIHSTHNLAIDQHGNSYVSVWTSSPDFPTTPGAFQRVYKGDYSDWAVAKLSPTGALLASTLIGGSEGENPDGIYVDAHENVYISGYTRSTDFPVTVATGQVRDGQKGAVVKLSADFSQLLYSAYMNGSKRDDLRASFLDADGNWYIGGESGSVDWPVKNAFQKSFAGQGDCIVASLKPAIAETMAKNIKYEVVFSTYLGGSRGEDTARAVAMDSEGYIYITGGTQSPDFPVTEGALDTIFATGGLSLGARGAMDVFLIKLDPSGSIVWSTYLGGPNYDRAYSVEVDSEGNVYIAGRAGDGFPITPGVIQEEFAGDSNPPGAYGKHLAAWGCCQCDGIGQGWHDCLHLLPDLSLDYDKDKNRIASRSVFYFMENDPDKLLAKYRADFSPVDR
jgi:hypothetical protein